MKAGRDPIEAGHAVPPSRADLRQLFAVIGGPVALLAALHGKYAIAQIWGCASNTAAIANHALALISFIVALLAARVARSAWSGAGREVPGDHDGAEGRSRTIAAVGLGVSLLSALVIIAQWVPQVVLDPCLQ
jgi:hypothetical protein